MVACEGRFPELPNPFGVSVGELHSRLQNFQAVCSIADRDGMTGDRTVQNLHIWFGRRPSGFSFRRRESAVSESKRLSRA